MHYYKFDVAKWVQSTRGMLPEEEGVYLRLVNHYYDTEQPIPKENRQVLKRLNLLSFPEVVADVLDEYFHLSTRGWVHKKIETLLEDFHEKSKKNKINGEKGGRPKQDKALSVTQKEPKDNPVGSKQKPKHNPNYKLLITNNNTSSPTSKAGRTKTCLYSEQDLFVATLIFNGVSSLTPDMKQPNLPNWADVIRLMRERDGRTHEQIEILFTWANDDDFWHTVILSPRNLREKWDMLSIKMKQKMNGGSKRLGLPVMDELLADFARKHGLSKAQPGESFPQYRHRLRGELEKLK